MSDETEPRKYGIRYYVEVGDFVNEHDRVRVGTLKDGADVVVNKSPFGYTDEIYVVSILHVEGEESWLVLYGSPEKGGGGPATRAELGRLRDYLTHVLDH